MGMIKPKAAMTDHINTNHCLVAIQRGDTTAHRDKRKMVRIKALHTAIDTTISATVKSVLSVTCCHIACTIKPAIACMATNIKAYKKALMTFFITLNDKL
jgi:hypothetical protein